MDPSSSRSVIVVGGGIFGVSSARELARLGASVTLVTDGALGSGASGRSLSWLNSARRRSMAYHHLRMAGIDRYRTLLARHPEAASWLRFDGGLTWDAAGPDNDIEEVAAHERSIGYAAEVLAPNEVATVTPGVDPSAITGPAAIFNPGEGWVDLTSLIDHLAIEFVARGGTVLENAGRVELQTSGGRAAGVTLPDGRTLSADAVLVAAGPSVPALLAPLGIVLPDQTPISCLVRTAPVAHPLRAVLNTPRVAIRPDVGGRFVLDADWAEEGVTVETDGTYTVGDDTVRELLAEASRVLAGNPALVAESCGVGPKPIPGDGDPVFGELDGVRDAFVAFSHSGATLGLIAGELLAREIATGERHPMLQPFRPGRFGAAHKTAAA